MRDGARSTSKVRDGWEIERGIVWSQPFWRDPEFVCYMGAREEWISDNADDKKLRIQQPTREVVMELEERGLCQQRQQSMDNDNGNTQQSNSTREKGEEDVTNGRTNEQTNK